MENSESRLIKLTEHLCSAFKDSLPFYSCRKSKHTYKQYQLAVIWCLMKYLKTDYRRIMELIELMPALRQAICIDKTPHFTTVNKFFLRINTPVIHTMLMKTVLMFGDDTVTIAIDATGYSSNYASRHYLWRIGLGNYTKRKYVKLSLSVCTDSQCIIAAKSRLGPRNDNIDFPGLVRRSSGSNPEFVVADKGYDSEMNHDLLRSYGITPMIPLRENKYGTVRKRQRRKMLIEFDTSVYNRRSLVETVNSVMKRLMGSWVISRSLVNQKKELLCMCVIYNVHRYVSISLTCWMISTEPYKTTGFPVLSLFFFFSFSRFSLLI
jgi:hypothetical protein